MKVDAIKTQLVKPAKIKLLDLIDQTVTNMDELSVLAITSKVVSLCEGRVIKISDSQLSKEDLIARESQYFLPAEISKYHHHFSIAGGTLISSAGIDVSNGDGHYVLWPEQVQGTADLVRQHLAKRFDLKSVGVIITDSTSQPLRLGTMGISLAHSGFRAVNDYRGKADLFGRRLRITRANVAAGLAASAVLAMGEGDESTPFCILSDLAFVEFQQRGPTTGELEELKLTITEDYFAPFLSGVKWQKGGKPTLD